MPEVPLSMIRHIVLAERNPSMASTTVSATAKKRRSGLRPCAKLLYFRSQLVRAIEFAYPIPLIAELPNHLAVGRGDLRLGW